MPTKDKKEKVKPIVWSSGRGGAGNISKTKNIQQKVPVDPDVRPQVKILEIETARNRSTAGGRGGRGNRYDHVLEPGLFQRVMQHETARIVAAKAETEANRATKMTNSRARSKSVLSRDGRNGEHRLSNETPIVVRDDPRSSPVRTEKPKLTINHSLDPQHSSRPSTRLRSASTSTFGTSISGSSASPSNVSSSIQSQYTRSATPASSVASRLFSPVGWKRRVFGGGSVDSTGANSIWSLDNTSQCNVTPSIRTPTAIPESYGARSSSMYSLPTPMASESFSNSNSKASRSLILSTSQDPAASFDLSPQISSSSCSPPRVSPRPAPESVLSSTSDPKPVPVRPPRADRPRGFALPSGARLAIYDRDMDRDFTSAPLSLSLTQNNVDVSVTASESASASRVDGLDGYPFLVEGRIPDCQEQPFTAYHLPLRPNIVRHNFPIPISPMRKRSDSGVSFI